MCSRSRPCFIITCVSLLFIFVLETQLAFGSAASVQVLDEQAERCPTPKRGVLDLPLDDTYMTKAILAESDEVDLRKWGLLLQKLHRGMNITIATFGGSITFGHRVNVIKSNATYRHWLGNWLNSMAPCGDNRFTVINMGHGGAHPLETRCQFLSDYHPGWQAGQESWRPALDLIILEFAVNGVGPDHGWSYELLVRSIMARFPTAPIIGFGTFYWADGSVLRPFHSAASVSIEMQVAIAQHYGFPYVSAREAFYDSALIQDEDHPKMASGAAWDDLIISKWMFQDGLHPNQLGHQYYAALLTRLILRKLSMARHVDVVNSTQLAQENTHSKPALHHINAAHSGESEMCFLSNNFPSIILENKGFRFASDSEGKVGYISENSSTLVLHSPFQHPKFIFTVFMLCGWDNIADAQIECISGCECTFHPVSGTWMKHTTEIVPVMVNVHNSTADCKLSITTLPLGKRVHQRISAMGMMLV